jgi:predicted outer membrane repeat protein
MRCATFLLVWLVLPLAALSNTLHVPGGYPTIQSAIDTANDWDTVLVAPGTYNESIDFKGKTITVMSSHGAEETIIDGASTSVATFKNGEGRNSILVGFTLTSGYGTWYGPYAGAAGGGIYCDGTSPTIQNNIITSNSVAFYSYDSSCGGGIFSANGAPMILNNLIEDNSAGASYSSGLGGGIGCIDSDAEILNNRIIDNSAGSGKYGVAGGGGIYCKGGAPIIAYNHLRENTAYEPFAMSGPGQAIYCRNTDALILNNWIMNNGAYNWSGSGGGIYCYEGSNEIRGNVILGNKAATGGGIVLVKSSPVIVNNMICGNLSYTGGGISCYNGSNPLVINNTVHGNTSDDSGGGLYCTDHCTITALNTIFWNNSAPAGKEVHLNDWSDLVVSYSDIEGGLSHIHVSSTCNLIWGDGMIDADPMVVDAGCGDYHLLRTSPCIDAGRTESAPALDFDNDPRPYLHGIDIGADEFHTHLYYIGDATPGGDIDLKLIDDPGITPVLLWLGSGASWPPMSTMYGPWYLEPPLILTLNLGVIPGPDGLILLPINFPPEIPVPLDFPLQALVGDKLTNPCIVEYR